MDELAKKCFEAINQKTGNVNFLGSIKNNMREILPIILPIIQEYLKPKEEGKE